MVNVRRKDEGTVHVQVCGCYHCVKLDSLAHSGPIEEYMETHFKELWETFQPFKDIKLSTKMPKYKFIMKKPTLLSRVVLTKQRHSQGNSKVAGVLLGNKTNWVV